MPQTYRTLATFVLTTAALACATAQAQAQSIIKRPGAHPN